MEENWHLKGWFNVLLWEKIKKNSLGFTLQRH